MTKDNKNEKDTKSERQLNYEEDRKYIDKLVVGPPTVYRLTEHSQKEDEDDDEEV